MKKLILLGVLSLAALSVPTREASALFGRVFCRGECGYAVGYYYRPYNAFDPCCCGGGCRYRPGLCHGRGCVPWCPPCLPSCFCDPCCGPGMCCMNSGCCDAGSLPPAMPTMPTMPAPGPAVPSGPVFTPPMPAPVPATSQMYYYPMPLVQNTISMASYQPSYYPAPTAGYYPMGYYPVMPAANPAPYAPWGMPGYGQ